MDTRIILAILGTVLTIFGGSLFFSDHRIEDQSVLKIPAFMIGIIILLAMIT